MSAVPAERPTTLELAPTAQLPRLLILAVLPDGDVQVSVFAPKDRRRHITFACAPRARCRIERDGEVTCLWVGRAAFDLVPSDVVRLSAAGFA